MAVNAPLRQGLRFAIILGICLPRRAAWLAAEELLHCDGDPEWAAFREHLRENAAQGFPLDADLAMKAQDLLQRHQEAMALDAQSVYGASEGMRSFFVGCNSPPAAETQLPPPFCLYGAVAMRSTLDFMESSGWPLSSVDVLANLQHHDEEFRLPADLDEYRIPWAGDTTAQGRLVAEVPTAGTGAAARIVVWEVGVHATLSAEPLQMWARFVPRAEFAHRNLIQDQYPEWLPSKCSTLYHHTRLTCDTTEDDITELFRRRIPHSATSKDPIDSMGDFAAEFEALAGDRFRRVDIFLCTVAYLCLLAETSNLPVLGYFGHPLLFMVPKNARVREDFWSRFVRMAGSRNVGFAVSDPFLQMQFEYQVGAPRLPAIRTHALYTGAVHFPVRVGEVLVMDRPHECVLMCFLQRLLPQLDASDKGEAGDSDNWPMMDGRLRAAGSSAYPYRFLTRALTDRSFSTFAQFRAVVLWPYDMDLITFYEFYSMGMPIFMPSDLPKYLFQQDHMDYNGRWEGRQADPERPQMWPLEVAASPFEEGSLEAVRHTLLFSDYFRFPEVQYFSSIPELLKRLPETDFFEVVQRMARFNQDSLIETSNAWRALLRRTTAWDPEVLQL